MLNREIFAAKVFVRFGENCVRPHITPVKENCEIIHAKD